MPTLTPLPAESLPEFASLFDAQIGAIGYIPNSLLTMARDPGLLRAVGGMFDALWYPPTIAASEHWLLTYSTSWFAQSYYSAAHCALGGHEAGLTLEQIEALADFETSDAYSDKEKALLRVARAVAVFPSKGAAKAAEGLKPFFNEAQIAFICGLIAFVGYLNRWNELLDSTLEPKPAAWAREHMPAFPAA